MSVSRSTLFLCAALGLVLSNPLHLEWATGVIDVATPESFTTGEPAKNYLLFAVSSSGSSKVANKRVVKLGALGMWYSLGKRGDSMLASAVSPAQKMQFGTVISPDPIVAIAVANAFVYFWWQVSEYPSDNLLRKHFTASAQNLASGRLWTLVTSAFSHADSMHMITNFFLFAHAAQPLVYVRANHTQNSIFASMAAFWLFAFSACVASSAVSILTNRILLRRRYYESLGMSGLLYALWSVIAIGMPDVRFHLFGKNASAWEVMAANVIIDVLMRRRRIDLGCHLGGMMYGSLFMTVCGGKVSGFRSDSWFGLQVSLLLKRFQRLGRPRGWECRKGPVTEFLEKSILVSQHESAEYSFVGWLRKGLWDNGIFNEGSMASTAKRALVIGEWTLLLGMTVAVACFVLEALSRRADEARRREGY